MKSPAFSLFSAAAAFLGLLSVPASAGVVTLPGLFNTGVDAGGISQADDTTDIHWTFSGTPPTGTVPIVNKGPGFPIAPGGPWMGDTGTSAWISPRTDTTGDAGNYTYRTTFNIPAGTNLSEVFVRGRMSSDNATTAVLINGVATGLSYGGDFTVFSPEFAIGRGFQIGLNTLDFVVNEASGSAGAGGYTALRVEMTGGSQTPGYQSIPGLWNSGATSQGGLPGAHGATAGNITLGAGSPLSGPVYISTSAGGFPIGPWYGDSNDSSWIVPTADPDNNAPDGDYLYQISFDMTGLNTSTASILGRWAVDNEGVDILLNGVSTGNSNTVTGFGDWTPFSISTAEGDTFLSGVNTLTFVARNGAPNPNPAGVRWEFLSAGAAPVPEPAVALLGLAALGAAGARRRRVG